MSVTIRPAMVTTLGRAAQDVGDSVLGGVAGGLASGREDAEGARIQGLSAYRALAAVLTDGEWAGRDASEAVTSIGNKLCVTANTHGQTDGVSAELFRLGAVTVS